MSSIEDSIAIADLLDTLSTLFSKGEHAKKFQVSFYKAKKYLELMAIYSAQEERTRW